MPVSDPLLQVRKLARQVSFGSAAAGVTLCAEGIANKASPEMAQQQRHAGRDRAKGSGAWVPARAASPEPTKGTLEQHPPRLFDISKRRTTRTKATIPRPRVPCRCTVARFSASSRNVLSATGGADTLCGADLGQCVGFRPLADDVLQRCSIKQLHRAPLHLNHPFFLQVRKLSTDRFQLQSEQARNFFARHA